MIIGIDIGGTKIAAAIANDKGKILNRGIFPTEAKKGRKKVLENIVNAIKAVAGGKKFSSLGVSIASPIHFSAGTIINPPNLPFKHFNLKQFLKKKFRVKTYLDNDANCATLAEARFGNGKRATHFLYLTVSTGIGGGAFINGEIYRGKSGSASEFGHHIIVFKGPTCGCSRKGHFEALASGTALKKIFGISGEKLQAQLKKRNRKALSILQKYIQNLAPGIANLVNIFNPELILIGGGMANLGGFLFPRLTKAVKQLSLPIAAKDVKIKPSKFRTDGSLIGAISLCMK
jgi:glucokinase